MAIQLKRCTEEERVSSNTTLLPGQPLYTVDANKLYIDDGNNKPVKELSSLRVDSKQIDSSFTYNGEDVVFSDGTKGAQNGDIIPSAIASGQGSVAFGGVKYDYFTNPTTLAGNGADAKENWGRTTTSAEGRQCLAWGGSSHAYGDWSLAGGKDAKAYQGGSISLGGSCKAGLSEADIKATYMIKLPDSDTYITKYLYQNKKSYKVIESSLSDGNIAYEALDASSILGPYIISDHPEILEPVDELGAPVTYEANRFCFSGNTATSVGYGSTAFNSGKSIGRISFAANSATVHGAYSAGFGQNNTITVAAPNAFVAGATNTVQFDKSSALGWNLKTTRESQTVLGRYNKFTENTDDLLQVGGGNNDSVRYNFFGVRGDGRAYVYKGPSEAIDVVRLQELSTLRSDLTTGLNKKVAKVSTTYTQAGIGDSDFRFYGVHPANGSQIMGLAPSAGSVYSGNKSYTQSLAMYLGISDPNNSGKYLNTLIVDTPTTGVYVTKYAANKKYVDDTAASTLTSAKAYTYSRSVIDDKDASTLASAKNYTYSRGEIVDKDALTLASAKNYTYSQSVIDNKIDTKIDDTIKGSTRDTGAAAISPSIILDLNCSYIVTYSSRTTSAKVGNSYLVTSCAFPVDTWWTDSRTMVQYVPINKDGGLDMVLMSLSLSGSGKHMIAEISGNQYERSYLQAIKIS